MLKSVEMKAFIIQNITLTGIDTTKKQRDVYCCQDLFGSIHCWLSFEFQNLRAGPNICPYLGCVKQIYSQCERPEWTYVGL